MRINGCGPRAFSLSCPADVELPPVNKHGARMLPVAADTLWAEQDPKLSLSIGPIPRWHFPLASGLFPDGLSISRAKGLEGPPHIVHREVQVGSMVHGTALEGLQERVPGVGQSLVQPALNM